MKCKQSCFIIVLLIKYSISAIFYDKLKITCNDAVGSVVYSLWLVYLCVCMCMQP